MAKRRPTNLEKVPILLTTSFSKEQQVGALKFTFFQKGHLLSASSLYPFKGESCYQEAHLFSAVPGPSSPQGMLNSSTTNRSQPNMHIQIITDKMESKESQDSSTTATARHKHILEQLDLVAAPSRAPNKAVAKAYDLTGIEIYVFHKLAIPWERIEGNAKQDTLTTEILENFLKAVFKRWDTTHGAPMIPDGPKKRDKRQMSVQIGKWANDAPESVAKGRKRKQEGFDESKMKEAKARKLGATAWLAVSTEHPEVVKFEFRDDNQQMVSQTKVKVSYHPYTAYESAQVQSMRVFDQAEAARAEDFNKRLLISLARSRIVAFAKNGSGLEDSPSPLIAADHQLGKCLFTPYDNCNIFILP